MKSPGREFTLARALLEDAHSLALLLAPDGSILDLNQHMANSLGQTLENLKGTVLWLQLSSESRATYQALVQRVLGERQPLRQETLLNGRWYDSCLTPCLDDQGQAIGVAVVGWDITEHRRTEEALRYTTARLGEAQGIANMGSFVYDIPCDHLSSSPQLLSILGFGPDDKPTRASWSELLHPDDRDVVEAALAKCLERGVSFDLDYRIIRLSDGQTRWLRGMAKAELDSSGKIVGVRGVNIDLTERREAELAAQESEMRFAALADSASFLIWASGTDKRCNYFNKGWLDFTGRTMAQELGDGWTGSVHADDRPRCMETYRDSFEAHQPFRLEYRLRRHDGQYRWLLDSGVPRYHANGCFTGYIGSAIDITEAKQAEQALRNAAAYARSLIEANLDPLVTINTEGMLTDVNEATVHAIGIPRSQLIGTDFSAYTTDPAKAREGYLKTFNDGVVRDLPLGIRHVSGRVMDVVCNVIVYHDAQGQVLGVFAAARDITERKRAEEAVSASEAKLHAIIDASPVAMAVNDGQDNMTFLNRRFVEVFGYTLEDIPTVAAWWPLAYPQCRLGIRIDTGGCISM